MSHQQTTGLEPGERLTFWITVTSIIVTLVCAIGVITLLLTMGESPVVISDGRCCGGVLCWVLILSGGGSVVHAGR